MAKLGISHSNINLRKESLDLARNAMALHPKLPAAQLVGPIIEQAEPAFLDELDKALRSRHFIQAIKTVRSEDRREESVQGWLFPEIRAHAAKLPEMVPTGADKKLPKDKLRFEDLKRYLRVLIKKDSERQRTRRASNPQIVAVKSLMKLWPPRSKKTQGITLAEVDTQIATRAGLV